MDSNNRHLLFPNNHNFQSCHTNEPTNLICQLRDIHIFFSRKCETAYPVTSWLPCPALLNIPDCTSNSLSAAGRLPLACYPDIGPFANIMPISQVMRMSSAYNVSQANCHSSIGTGRIALWPHGWAERSIFGPVFTFSRVRPKLVSAEY